MQQIILNLTGEIGTDQELMNKVDLMLEMQFKALLYQGLTLYISTLPAEQLAQPLQIAIDQKPVLPAVNFINNNLALPFLNSELAQLCQMSEGYFLHRFKDCMGQTPGEFIREKRVKLAAQKLFLTTDSIEQIAVSTGDSFRIKLIQVLLFALRILAGIAQNKAITDYLSQKPADVNDMHYIGVSYIDPPYRGTSL